MAFAAEESRIEGNIVHLQEFMRRFGTRQDKRESKIWHINSTDSRLCTEFISQFSDEELVEAAYVKGSMLLNETYSFQVAFRSERILKGIIVKIESTIDPFISVRSVGVMR